MLRCAGIAYAAIFVLGPYWESRPDRSLERVRRLFANLAKFSSLSVSEQWTILTAAACMPLFSAGLRIFGLRRLDAWLRTARVPEKRGLPPEQVMRLGDLVNIAARHVPCGATCLTRSLVLGWLLQRRGVATELRIGVRLVGGVLDAHAWVEYLGVPVNDRRDVALQFAPFSGSPALPAFSSS